MITHPLRILALRVCVRALLGMRAPLSMSAAILLAAQLAPMDTGHLLAMPCVRLSHVQALPMLGALEPVPATQVTLGRCFT